MSGTGECICPSHFSSDSYCTECLYGYYGKDCSSLCPVKEGMICIDLLYEESDSMSR